MRDFTLHAVLIRRRNEELEPQVFRKGQQLVAPRRVDPIEGFVEKQERRLGRFHAIAAMEEEFCDDEDQEVVPATVIEDQVSVGRNKPVTPQNVTATQVVGGVEIKWTKDENADYYVVYRAKSEEGPYQKIGTSKGDSLLNVFVGQKDYYYKVVAHQTGSPSYDTEPSAPVKVTVTKLLGVIGG